MLFAKEIGINHSIFEGDSEVAVNFLCKGYMLGSTFRSFSKGTLSLANSR